MPILSFLSRCFYPDGSRNHTSLPIGSSEVKGSGDQLVSVDSKVQTRWSESVPANVISELPPSNHHGQSMLVDSKVLNNNSHQCHNTSEIFKYSELEEATNNFDASRILGSGGYGTVYSGKKNIPFVSIFKVCC